MPKKDKKQKQKDSQPQPDGDHGQLSVKELARKATDGAQLADIYREKATAITEAVMRALYFLTKEDPGAADAARARNALMSAFSLEPLAEDWQDYWLWTPIKRPSNEELLTTITELAHGAVLQGVEVIAIPALMYRWFYEAVCASALPPHEPEAASPSSLRFSGVEVITHKTLAEREQGAQKS